MSTDIGEVDKLTSTGFLTYKQLHYLKVEISSHPRNTLNLDVAFGNPNLETPLCLHRSFPFFASLGIQDTQPTGTAVHGNL